jgi:hypothetical protein
MRRGMRGTDLLWPRARCRRCERNTGSITSRLQFTAGRPASRPHDGRSREVRSPVFSCRSNLDVHTADCRGRFGRPDANSDADYRHTSRLVSQFNRGSTGDRRPDAAILRAGGYGCVDLVVKRAHSWWMYRRWGRVPRILTLSGNGLIFTRLGWHRMREKTWPINEITAIELRTVKFNLNWKRTVADLCFHRRTGRRLRFRLSSANAQLPNQIAQKFGLGMGFSHTAASAKWVRYE